MFGLTLRPAIVMLSDDRMAVGAILIDACPLFIAAVRQGTLTYQSTLTRGLARDGVRMSVVGRPREMSLGRVGFPELLVVCFGISDWSWVRGDYLVFLFFLRQIH